MRHRENGHEVEELLGSLGESHSIGEGELRTLARTAAAGKRAEGLRRRPFALRWIGAAAGVALLVGSALGFGLGASLTPSGSAGTNLAGTGFLPARGWTVVQTGTVDANGASRAVAANVPLRPEDASRAVPYATLESLSKGGAVIVATFTTRGDAGADFAYPVQALPLQLSRATRVPGGVSVPHTLSEYRLRAGLQGTNVYARIFFGTPRPTRADRAAAQRQLNRLVVASDRVTIFARPTIVDREPVELFGSVDNGRAGETIAIQAKDCGSNFFRLLLGAETRDGGGWSITMYPRITTTLRAVWRDTASTQVTIRQRAVLWLTKRRAAHVYYVAVAARRSFWHKRVLVERRSGRRWITAKTVLLTDTPTTRGAGGGGAAAEFELVLPKGSLIRARMTSSQAGPCYLSGVSQTVRV